MNYWLIFPILIPCLTAVLIILGMYRDHLVARTFSMIGVVLNFIVSVSLLQMALHGDILTYNLGDWLPPFGITFVLDRLSALMLVLTSVLAFFILLYSLGGLDRQGRHFHSLIQFQIMGLNGAFLTGDLFNLFVFFEVLLIASYALMVHGGGATRIKAGVQYVAVNLVGSALFLIAAALIYGVAGTLNMADLAVKVAALPASEQALLHTGALLLLVVFAIKAALVPFQFWLPGTYGNTAAPVAALFAILTKVGAYSIIRVYTLIFGESTAWIAAPWLLPAGLVTLVVGTLGILAAKNLGQLISFAVIGSMGTLMIPISLFTTHALAAALYYLLHSTVAAAALFLLVDLIRQRRKDHSDNLTAGASFAQRGLIASLFFLGAIAMTGMPPLSGFIGKLMILNSSREENTFLIWGIILSMSLLSIIGFAKGGSTLFWKTTPANEKAQPVSTSVIPFISVTGLLLFSLMLVLFAEPILVYATHTAQQLLSPTEYIQSVFSLNKEAP